MKIIFSRKGFDSSAGGCPSPLLDDQPLSLPIPTHMPSVVTFAELPRPLPRLVHDLTNNKIRLTQRCHLDPDLGPELSSTTHTHAPGWRGSLGQTGAALGHLNNQDVGPGDLFLFWGLFRPVVYTDRWRYQGRAEHRIFGWLQIDQKLNIGPDPTELLQSYPWLADHPHVRPGWTGSNAVYIGTKQLNLAGLRRTHAGYGTFTGGHRLTVPGSRTPSTWTVPKWLNPTLGGVGMTYHKPARWQSDGRLFAAARGQEFVADLNPATHAAANSAGLAWLVDLFSST